MIKINRLSEQVHHARTGNIPIALPGFLSRSFGVDRTNELRIQLTLRVTPQLDVIQLAVALPAERHTQRR